MGQTRLPLVRHALWLTLVSNEEVPNRRPRDDEALGYVRCDRTSGIDMKSCTYCGKENQDTAGACVECGTSSFYDTTSTGARSPVAKDLFGETTLRSIITSPPRLFRALIILATSTYLIYWFQLLLGKGLISHDVWDALSWDGYEALLTIPDSVLWLLMLLWVAVTVGLYGFSKAARFVFLWLTLFSTVTALLGGVTVQTAFGTFLCLITNLADGAILAMAYSTPLKERFA